MLLITVTQTQGSVPREADTWMVVTGAGIIGTLGGGNVEHQAIAYARQFKLGDESTKRFALGPSLGQCCGGVMDLSFEVITQSRLDALQGKLDAACQPIAGAKLELWHADARSIVGAGGWSRLGTGRKNRVLE